MSHDVFDGVFICCLLGVYLRFVWISDCQYSALSRLTAFVFAVYQEHDRYLLVSQ